MNPIFGPSNMGFSLSAFFMISGAIFERKNITTSNEHRVMIIPKVLIRL